MLARCPRRLVWDPTFAFGDRQRTFDSAKHFFDEYGRCTYQPGRGDLKRKFTEFCEYALAQSNAMVFVDEPSMLGGSHALPQSFHDLHRLGHKRGLGVTIASHSVWDLPNVTQTYHHAFVFRVTRVVDQNALTQLMGAEAVMKIERLPDHWYYYKGLRWKGVCKPLDLSRARTSTPLKPDGVESLKNPQ